MNKLLTLSLTIIFASLFFQSCSNEEQDLPEGESPNVPDKDSSIDSDGKTYCTWIKDASYYIGIYNTETKDKIAEIPTVIEGGLNQTANMHYGESKGYTINGCYILDIKKNEKDIYILLEYSEDKYELGITELLMLRDNKITKRIKYTNGIGRPNKLIYWYDKEIVATANGDLSKYASDDFYIYSSGLDLVYNSSEMSNYYFFLNTHPVDTYRFIWILDDYIRLKDIKKGFDELWSYKYTDENVVIKQKEINVNGETVEISMEFVYKDGSKEIKSFKLNLEDGSLIE